VYMRARARVCVHILHSTGGSGIGWFGRREEMITPKGISLEGECVNVWVNVCVCLCV
jgi:hypothetical protein